MNEISDVRPSPIAGQWYARNAAQLSDQVDGYMNAAELPDLEGDVVAVIAPHAGHVYSGPVAGYAFATLRELSPQVVAVISPMHHPYFEPLLTTSHAYYETPLGEIPVDCRALDDLDKLLKEELGSGLRRVAYDQEHSLEIELPFLQRALSKPFRLLPVMVREQSARVARALGRSLARLVSPGCVLEDQEMILVASTDLSHFYSQSVAVTLDKVMLRRVEEFDPEGVISTEERGEGFACGRGAMAAVLWAAKELGADRAQVLNYATSGDVTGDYERVVGYAAAVITRQADVA
jgi:AmmeMemoRadiSam system protein B